MKGVILKCFPEYKYGLVRDQAFHKTVLHQTTETRGDPGKNRSSPSSCVS
jgi:hypothetical protein